MKELTYIQKRRIYMKYYINMKNVDIAKIETVSEGAIRKSIKQSISYLRRKMYMIKLYSIHKESILIEYLCTKKEIL